MTIFQVTFTIFLCNSVQNNIKGILDLAHFEVICAKMDENSWSAEFLKNVDAFLIEGSLYV